MIEQRRFFQNVQARLKSWEFILFIFLVIVLIWNGVMAKNYFTILNQINLFNLSIEKILVAITMAFLIINGEIDLSAPSIMGLSAVVMAVFFRAGLPL